MKRRLTLLTVLAALVAGGVMAASSFSARTMPPPVVGKVIMTEFKFRFAIPTTRLVTPGRQVILTVVNHGKLVHNIDFQTLGKRTPIIAPGKSTVLRVTFPKKGSYPYVCDVPRHAEQGMAGNFVVK
jgi:plastocyanin